MGLPAGGGYFGSLGLPSDGGGLFLGSSGLLEGGACGAPPLGVGGGFLISLSSFFGSSSSSSSLSSLDTSSLSSGGGFSALCSSLCYMVNFPNAALLIASFTGFKSRKRAV